MPGFDAARAAFSYTDGMDLDGSEGSLDVTRFEVRSLLSRPITPMEGLTILPVFDYKMTALEFDGTPAAFPIGDEVLNSVAVSMVALKTCSGSPWIYGAWARAELASDFQDIGGDDFTFDIAGGAGYRFSDGFTLGFGGAVMNLNGDTQFYPGVGFDWIVNDKVRIGLYGPTFIAAYTPDENWLFSLREDASGGIWNISGDHGKSQSIDLTTYNVGLYASRRLTGQFWLTAGVGASVVNEISLTKPNGGQADEQDLGTGMFGQISLRLKAW